MSEHPVITIEHPKVPQEAIDFANEVSALAERYSLKSCDVTFKLDASRLEDRHPNGHTTQYRGVFTAHCELLDGRGRPFRRVHVQVDSTTKVLIQNDPQSTS